MLAETTADLAFALILAACRLLSDSERDLRQGGWKKWELAGYLGQDVHGATLGIVGYGRVGQEVAKRAGGFSMRVIHYDLAPTGQPGWVGDLDELVSQADIVSLHVPLTAETHHLIDARRLALMKPTAVLVNTARGPVVDEEALGAALESGRLLRGRHRRLRKRADRPPALVGGASGSAAPPYRQTRLLPPGSQWRSWLPRQSPRCSLAADPPTPSTPRYTRTRGRPVSWRLSPW